MRLSLGTTPDRLAFSTEDVPFSVQGQSKVRPCMPVLHSARPPEQTGRDRGGSARPKAVIAEPLHLP